jgi:CubicO group peptidase (beta-lactamase class C family)
MAIFKFILFAFVVPIAAIGTCYNPGPAFPPVNHVLNQTHFDKLSAKLTEVIKDVLDSPEGWTINTTSFAVQVTSSRETLWSHYYTAPVLGEYEDSPPTSVSGDTAFRVASISKTFTVYAILLQHGINLEDPITKYIPELLEGEKDKYLVQWDQITIRSLASQLSGISRESMSSCIFSFV